MAKTEHPWQVGPTELIEFAIESIDKGGDFDRRLAFLVLDVGVETLFKTYLTLPDSVNQYQINRDERFRAAKGNFPELLRAVQNADTEKASGILFSHIEHYHNLRNMLYHQGNQVTAIPMYQLDGYARLAVNLLIRYHDIDLSEKLMSHETSSDTDDYLIEDSVEVELSFGRFRIEKMKSQSIRVYSIVNKTFETPVKPFLRAVIDELSLPIDFAFRSGKEKNTQALGKDVIDELKIDGEQKKTKPQKSELAERELQRIEFWKHLIDRMKTELPAYKNLSPAKTIGLEQLLERVD